MITAHRALRRKCSFNIRRLNFAIKLALNLINQCNYDSKKVENPAQLTSVLSFAKYSERSLRNKLIKTSEHLQLNSEDYNAMYFLSTYKRIRGLLVKAAMIIALLDEVQKPYEQKKDFNRMRYPRYSRRKQPHRCSIDSLLMTKIPEGFTEPCLMPENLEQETLKNNTNRSPKAVIDIFMEPPPILPNAPCLKPMLNMELKHAAALDKDLIVSSHVLEIKKTDYFRRQRTGCKVGDSGTKDLMVSSDFFGWFLPGLFLPWFVLPWYVHWRWKF